MVGLAPAPRTEGALALKQFAVERLAQHRHRRATVEAQEAEMEARVRARRESVRGDARQGASRVRDAVTARYEQSVSYREFLAQEAGKALERAQAEAEIAARNAKAIADEQRRLLTELNQYEAEPTPRQRMMDTRRAEGREELAHALADLALGARELMQEPAFEYEHDPAACAAGLRVQMAAQLGPSMPESARRARHGASAHDPGHEDSTVEMEALDAELAFRHSEGFDRQNLELTPIPGNLIEFPRQLIASRRVRPRLAEGPLREEMEAEPQLRIFEVEPEQVSFEPVAEGTSMPEWHGMMLDEPVLSMDDPLAMLPAATQVAIPLQPAALERRMMSMLMDGGLVALGFVGFATVFARLAPRVLASMTLPHLGVAAAVALVAICALYQLLFFSFSEATPGMRVARVGLCTFADDNPSRKAMRLRLLLTLLAAAPLGLGILWMAVDGERLGWHDRMSRMYLREY
jgi:uncharacterized RDD family membrane protein YckC